MEGGDRGSEMDEKAHDGGEMCGFMPRCSPIRLSSAANGNDVDARGGRLNQPKCPEVSASRDEKEGGREKQSEMRGHDATGWRKKQRETSRLALETGEKKSETCA